jgi:hypothetical protein
VGTYFLIVELTASDDVNGLNDYAVSGGVALTSPPSPDYKITTPNFPPSGTPGGALGVPRNFMIEEDDNNPGSQPVTWTVYISEDQILNVGDTQIDTGTIGPLGALGSHLVDELDFTGNWPGGYGKYYYIIATVTADDDENPINDTLVSSPIPVPDPFIEAEPNDDDPPPPVASQYNDVGTLNDGHLIEVSGNISALGTYDTFRFTPAPGVTTVEFEATWATGFDDIDLDFWHNVPAGVVLNTADASVNTEPSSPPWTIINLTPGEEYCIGVFFFLSGGPPSVGQPYALRIRGLP